MGSKAEAINGRPEPANGYRSPDVRDSGFKYGTPVPTEADTPGARDYESQRQSRNSMLTPGDKLTGDVKRFTGKSTLKNPFGSSTTLSSQAPTEASDDPEQDHINVVLRVRPLNSNETTRKDQFSCTFPGSGKIEVDNNGAIRQFGYNVVFEPDAIQADLFDHSGVKRLIDMSLNGYACTALAFGQTGSGKTHTMTGPPQQFQEGKQVDPENYGIIQRSLKYLFQQLQQQQGNKIVRASYLEIYNEQVIDLLNPNMRRYLQVRWSKNKGFYVENLFVVECETEDDLTAVLEEGMRNRQTGSHGLNEFSSRSHSMLMLTIDSEMQDPDDENLYITKRGKLTFVDLAGSEKVKDSNSTADTLVESNSINKSLLVLGNCISSLGDQKRRQGHIPYRDSKLTKLLADSLGGNGVTLMICCITPSSYHAPETMNTLRYASRAKKIRTKPVIKMDPREKLILSLKREIKVLRNENHYLRQQTGIPTKVKPKPKPNNDVKNPNDKKEPDAENLKKPSDVIRNYAKNKENLEFPAKPRGQLQKENDQKVMKIMKETNGKSDTNNTVSNNDEKMRQGGNGADESGLYEMLQEYMVENEALRTENAEMQVNRDKVRQDQQLLYRDNEKLMKRVDDLERRLNQATTSWQSMPRQDSHRSRDHSPRGSPQYRGGGSGGKVVQAKFAQPPADLPLRDNPALRDPIYPGSPPQGYNSPTSNGRSKPSQQPATAPRSQPLKPPHRLADPIQQQRPAYEQNGPPYMNGNPGSHPAGHGFPAGHPAMQPGPGHHPGIGTQYRQPHIGSPNRPNGSGMYYNYDLRMDSRKSSTSSSSDAIRDMNEKLKQELAQLDGQIHHHHVYNQHKNTYGSQGSMR
ncbi:kinesin-II 85 kDa subunit-like isoform X15 [Mercenaria mercenaria]|uniref:kinesin-II 85 kDa subunit-like isoform X15 n=1 Tax=Mercenaria mercenaria TaxID=6596 RepID=UPI00234EC19B|nr:kinesin-II 85 kDa subunit-like isoform X15 [Mercenaria mercenaria]